MKLIHLSDLHLIGSNGTLYDNDPHERLNRAIADVNEHHRDADLVVITGDLTHWADRAAYEILKSSLKKMVVPYRLLIGNHDDRETFLQCFPETTVDPAGFVQSTIQTPEGTLVFLDTNEPGTDAGHLCAARIAWFDQILNDKTAPFFVFMHHPPCSIGLEPMDRIKIIDPDSYVPVFRSHAKNIKHIFFGHIHRPLSGSWLNIPLSAVPSLHHQVALDFTATGNSIDFSREKPGYAVILIESEQVVVHTHDFTYQLGTYSSTLDASSSDERPIALGTT